MAKKSRERFKDRNKSNADAEAKPSTTLEILKRRRYKRLIVVLLIGLAFPILEVIAYQYRAITVTFSNKTDEVIKGIKVVYDGGAFEIDELKPLGVTTRVIRPDFSFKSKVFATYLCKISFFAGKGYNSQIGRVGTIDFSATEQYTIESIPPNNQVQIRHNTRPGFPLSLIRDLMEKLGIG